MADLFQRCCYRLSRAKFVSQNPGNILKLYIMHCGNEKHFLKGKLPNGYLTPHLLTVYSQNEKKNGRTRRINRFRPLIFMAGFWSGPLYMQQIGMAPGRTNSPPPGPASIYLILLCTLQARTVFFISIVFLSNRSKWMIDSWRSHHLHS